MPLLVFAIIVWTTFIITACTHFTHLTGIPVISQDFMDWFWGGEQGSLGLVCS